MHFWLTPGIASFKTIFNVFQVYVENVCSLLPSWLHVKFADFGWDNLKGRPDSSVASVLDF